MDINIFGFKFRLEILILIVVVYFIMCGHLFCSCCKMNLMEGFTGANTNYGQSSPYTLGAPGYKPTEAAEKWGQPSLLVQPGKPLDSAVKKFLDRKPQPVPLPEGELNMFERIKVLFIALLLSNVCSVKGQSAGFSNTFLFLSLNGGANTHYDLNAATAHLDFNNLNLGSFNPAYNSLILKGGEYNVWKCGGCDLTSTRINYRIYPTASAGGGFSQMNLPYSSGFNNGCGGQDQIWSVNSNSVNVLSGLSPGTYFFEVYSDATVTCSGGTVYASNSGSNYKATFTVLSDVISLNTIGAWVSEDFNTLANSGSSSIMPIGWSILETGTNANSSYTVGTGSSNLGDSYSFGAASATDRSLGGLFSGSLNWCKE
jgi:hypothetical protein